MLMLSGSPPPGPPPPFVLNLDLQPFSRPKLLQLLETRLIALKRNETCAAVVCDLTWFVVLFQI